MSTTKKPRPYRPSATALRVLRNLAADKPATAGMDMSMSLSGGLTATVAALTRHGMIDMSGNLTDAGRAAAARSAA